MPEILKIESPTLEIPKTNVYFLQSCNLWEQRQMPDRPLTPTKMNGRGWDFRRGKGGTSEGVLPCGGCQPGERKWQPNQIHIRLSIPLTAEILFMLKCQQSLISHVKRKCSYLYGAFHPKNPKMPYKLTQEYVSCNIFDGVRIWNPVSND